MAISDGKGVLDGGATSTLDRNENKTSGGAIPNPGSVEDTIAEVQDATPQIVYPGTASYSLIALALCLVVYVITLVRPHTP